MTLGSAIKKDAGKLVFIKSWKGAPVGRMWCELNPHSRRWNADGTPLDSMSYGSPIESLEVIMESTGFQAGGHGIFAGFCRL